jgi:hypothetical protein
LHSAYAAAWVALVTRWRRAAAPMRTVLVALAGASALALLLVGAQLLPTMELAARSARADLPWSTVASGAFHAVDAIRFAVEEFFGTPLTGDEWASLFPKADGFYLRTQLNSFFVGTPLFLLAILGMCGARTRSAALPFTVLFIVAGLLAFATPLARLAHATLPGFAFARLDRVGALLVVAIISGFAFQVVYNITMSAGLAPVKGLTLPLMSSGGSSLVATLAGFGLILNVRMRRFTN